MRLIKFSGNEGSSTFPTHKIVSINIQEKTLSTGWVITIDLEGGVKVGGGFVCKEQAERHLDALIDLWANGSPVHLHNASAAI